MKRKWFCIIIFVLAVYLAYGATVMILRHITSASPLACRNMNSVNPLKLVDCDSLSERR